MDNAFAVVLRISRAVLGISQAELALRAGIDPDTVSRIETNAAQPHTRTVVKIAEALAKLGSTADSDGPTA